MFACHVSKSMSVADLPDQDSYNHELGDLFPGGDSRRQLAQNFRPAMDIPGLRFSWKGETND